MLLLLAGRVFHRPWWLRVAQDGLDTGFGPGLRDRETEQLALSDGSIFTLREAARDTSIASGGWPRPSRGPLRQIGWGGGLLGSGPVRQSVPGAFSCPLTPWVLSLVGPDAPSAALLGCSPVLKTLRRFKQE